LLEKPFCFLFLASTIKTALLRAITIFLQASFADRVQARTQRIAFEAGFPMESFITRAAFNNAFLPAGKSSILRAAEAYTFADRSLKLRSATPS
jgi:hypothetical protein